MRGKAMFALLALIAGPSVAWAAVPARPAPSRPVAVPPVTTPVAAPAPQPNSDAQLESLRQRLLASQQTIATLERELSEEKNRTIALERCRTKNGKLVGIGRQLVEGYQKRWRITHKDPFQLGRRRFEFEMQALSEAVYDEGVDITPKPASAPADASTDGPAATTAPTAPAGGN
ncbi:hypothetical protein [Novosphingobium sp.]|uniref:hypothetical protein n=1 Tax=Novosphingobium sp. TaxID=1874826 RepID=UPI0038B6E493